MATLLKSSVSHPFRQLCPWISKAELANFLVETKIAHSHDLFVANKPFGVGVRNPFGKKIRRPQPESTHLRGIQTCPYTLEDILPELRNILGEPQLILNKSAEKLTSGVSVFTKNEEIDTRFSKAVRMSKDYYKHAMYKYHIITTLPPQNLVHNYNQKMAERVGVMVKTTYGSDVKQPVIVKDYSNGAVERQEVVSIHVNAKLLQAGYRGGYLFEVNASRVPNNFLRIFCADKLAPILGDQLYSARVQTIMGIPTKIDPTHLEPGTSYQKLTPEIQQALLLNKPEDSVIVPTHVHLRSYKVRHFLGKKTEIDFEAPYPEYFKWTCEQLGITLDQDHLQVHQQPSQ